jgi:uncharacterized protein
MNSSWFSFQLQDFAYSFLSILFEGIPFLLLGSLLSGVIDVFVPAATLTRFFPRNSNAAIVLSGLLGAVVPMCECGSVVIIRRFIRKGLPVSCAVAYMLGAPIVSPIVALSTLAAFRGQSPWVMTSLRLILGFLIAVTVGFVVRHVPVQRLLQDSVLASLPERRRTGFRISNPADADAELAGLAADDPPAPKVARAIQSATSDFLDVAFFFVVGAAIAAVFNTSVNQQIISPLAQSPMLSVLAMMALAFALALCSSTDAFIAASFVAFPFAAKLAFLVFGPVFDIKLFFLYGVVFRRWFVVSLLVGLFILIAIICGRVAALNL